MKDLEKIIRKRKKTIIGLMSGTSVDGIDASIVEIEYCGLESRINELGFKCYNYPIELKNLILENSNSSTARLSEIANLNFLVGEFFADAVIKITKHYKIPLDKIDLIGSHGQTIFHSIKKTKILGKEIFATMQIGDPTVIAKRTGIVTVGDFRVADIAVGGNGAPLVPYFDYILFRSKNKNSAVLNIGGIANVTIIPKNSNINSIYAFDTGPGNMMIDYVVKKYFSKNYDKNGIIAAKGEIEIKLLNYLIEHPYFKIKPPKSCGRETFGENLILEILGKFKDVDRINLVTTLSEFTAISIYNAYEKFVKPEIKLDEVIVSGGGVHNKYLMKSLQKYFGDIEVKPLEAFGYSSDSKEAICFAFLANETICGNAGNIITATGARKRTILGKICLP